jgi:hypothetical protein
MVTGLFFVDLAVVGDQRAVDSSGDGLRHSLWPYLQVGMSFSDLIPRTMASSSPPSTWPPDVLDNGTDE